MEELRETIVKIFNENNLPLEAKFYVFKDVFRDIQDAYYHQLNSMEKSKKESEA